MGGATLTIIGTVLAVGIAPAGLSMRSTARMDADRRAADARFDRAMAEWRFGMDTFRAIMRSLAERQSRVDGRLEAGAGQTSHAPRLAADACEHGCEERMQERAPVASACARVQ